MALPVTVETGPKADTSQELWFGHPRGLSTLFFTELWERLSYYGMRALLVLFMTNAVATGGMGLTDVTATAIYGLYTSAVYMVALPGGWIADRLIGQRRAVLIGGIVIAAGHFTLAIPAVSTFYLGLMLIVAGTGLLKPNVSAMVGDLYPEGGARRDAGFSVYYMGINIGAFVGPLICGYLGENVNWHLGFGAAGIGMVLGVIQYVAGARHLGRAGLLSLSPETASRQGRDWRLLFGGLALFAAAFLAAVGLDRAGVVDLTFVGIARALGFVVVILAVLYFAQLLAFGGLTSVERKRVRAIFLLFVGAAVFWSGFEQAGSSMNLFAERLTDRVVMGWETPASWLQSVNALFIIIFAPVFAALWMQLGARNPSIPVKFGVGLVQLGVGFLVLAWGATYTADGQTVTPMWLVVTYFLHTTGELCLSPVGLSSVTKLSPQRLVGQMMGIWFMGSALGNLLAGLIAGLIASLPMPQLFSAVASITAGAGLVFLLMARPVQRLIGDVK